MAKKIHKYFTKVLVRYHIYIEIQCNDMQNALTVTTNQILPLNKFTFGNILHVTHVFGVQHVTCYHRAYVCATPIPMR